VSLTGWDHPRALTGVVLAVNLGGSRMSEGRVLFLYDNAAPFVKADLAILQSHFDVLEKDCSSGSGLREIFRAVRLTDISYSWFALGHAARAVLAGRILGRPSVVVSGGWDVISMPEISYGAARTFRGRSRARFVLRRATHVLTFSDWSRNTIRKVSGRESELLYLGVDANHFRPEGAKEDLVITAGTLSKENFTRKGLETFVRAAAQLPDVRFVLAGKPIGDAGDVLRKIAPANVEFTGWLPEDHLLRLLQRAKVYVQASYNEGFGLALAEAMACGCIPVVTRAGALPEVVGDMGFFVPYGDAPATARAIREALGSHRGANARRWIETRFPISRRRERLLALMRDALGE
jgi:glycosyltransferase involved in cell wall biosynthesis